MREIASQLKIGKSSVSHILKQARVPETDDLPPPETLIPEVVEGPSMSISETDLFLKSIQAPEPEGEEVDIEKEAFIRKMANSIRQPKLPEAEEEEEEQEPEPEPEQPKRLKPVPKAPEPDRGTLIAKISSLVLTFAPILTNHVKDPAKFIEQLARKPLEDLQTTLQLLDSVKTIHNGAQGMYHMFGMIAGAVELGGSKLHLQTSGYQAAIMSQGEELKRIFQEIAYNNVDKIRRLQSPEARLALLMTQTLLAIDSRNRSNQGGGQGNGTVPPETQERFNDL